MCGKDSALALVLFLILGSPPRVREGPPVILALSILFRITPACAGRTFFRCSNFIRCQDHPRVCGKDKDMYEIERSNYRITPACAGRTNFTRPNSDCWQDHPRVCGKDAFTFAEFNKIIGSPPRVREGLVIAWEVRQKDRITPACAGRTRTLFS